MELRLSKPGFESQSQSHMEIKYDFISELDLTYFRKQATHYVGSMRELSYRIYFPGYRVQIEFTSPDGDVKEHLVSIELYDIKRNPEGEILSEQVIFPALDVRFKNIKDVSGLFRIDHYRTTYMGSNVAETVDTLCRLMEMMLRLHKLRAFS